MRRWLAATVVAGAVCSALFGVTANRASGEQSEEMKRMQEQLNEQVMSKPFSVPAESEVKAYIAEAQKRGEVPPPYTGTHWRPGYTCWDLARYSRPEYLSCRYYHHYYGYYYRWP